MEITLKVIHQSQMSPKSNRSTDHRCTYSCQVPSISFQ